jgi:hypothetical protein
MIKEVIHLAPFILVVEQINSKAKQTGIKMGWPALP